MGVTLRSLRAARAFGTALAMVCGPVLAAPEEVLDAPAIEAPAPADSLPAPAAPVTPDAPVAPLDQAVPAVPPVEAAAPADTAKEAAKEAAIPAGPEAGPDDLTIEVDEGRSRNEGKSLPLALLASAVLPGTGELYLAERKKAKTFLLLEAGFWASLYVAWMARDSYLQSARNHASEHAGIDASGKGENFLETMESYRSYQEKQHRQDSYELAQVLSGKREQDYDIAPAPENYWDFGSSANPGNTDAWREFQGTMRYYRASKVALSFALGALALNRLASMVNTLQAYKRTSARSASLEVTPDLGPSHAGTRLTVRF